MECFFRCLTFGMCCCHRAARPNHGCTEPCTAKYESVRGNYNPRRTQMSFSA